MSKIPLPTQRRYRGRIRADMRSAYNHLQKLIVWDGKFRAKPINYYPNQLAPVADVATIEAASTLLLIWLNAKGQIASR